MADPQNLTVFYDGSCPLCAREIGFYRRRKGAERIDWRDISCSGEQEVAPGLSKDIALARFHVRSADGHLASGGEAFARLWTALPPFRLAGCILQRRPFVWCLNAAYDAFLKIRPCLQSLATRRMP
jgi:predicted DCC family thiol-disulfide oxidoreductase YuxK